MDPVLPNNFHFKVFSIFLSLRVSRCKLLTLISVNLIVILIQVVMQYTLRREIFAFVGKPVLMVLDCVALTSQLVSHIVLILEALGKRKTDFVIWNILTDINNTAGNSSTDFEKIFHRDFLLMSATPTLGRLAVILATYRTQPNWALGYLSRTCSSLINEWAVLVFIYYMRYVSDRFMLMAREVDSVFHLAKASKDSCHMIVNKIKQLKTDFNKIWHLHGLAKNRYEIFLTLFCFFSLCRLTSSMYFLGTRLVTRRFAYTLESTICLVPLIHCLVHLSVVAEDFKFKQRSLLESLQQLSEQNWSTPHVISVIKSFEIQLKLADLSPTVGGHLSMEYSTMILDVVSISTTYIFIFLFFN